MHDRLQAIATLDRVIHEPARLMIISILLETKEADFVYLLNESGLTKGNLSTHLGKLEEAGYVDISKTYRGKVPLTVCELTRRGRSAYRAYETSLSRAVARPAR